MGENNLKLNVPFLFAYLGKDERIIRDFHRSAKYLKAKPVLDRLNLDEQAVLLINSSRFISKYVLQNDYKAGLKLNVPIYDFVHNLFQEHFFEYRKSPRKKETYSTFSVVRKLKNKSIEQGFLSEKIVKELNPYPHSSTDLRYRLETLSPEEIFEFKKSYYSEKFKELFKPSKEDLHEVLMNNFFSKDFIYSKNAENFEEQRAKEVYDNLGIPEEERNIYDWKAIDRGEPIK